MSQFWRALFFIQLANSANLQALKKFYLGVSVAPILTIFSCAKRGCL